MQRKTYLRSIDAVFGKSDAHDELPPLIETNWVERRDGRLAFGAVCGDVLGLSVERETVSWAVIGPRGPIASNFLDAPILPPDGDPASCAELEKALLDALNEAKAFLSDRPLAGIGVAWPAAIDPDGEPYREGPAELQSSAEAPSPRELVCSAVAAAGIDSKQSENDELVVAIVNDADADLLYEARLGVARGVGDLLGVKICGGIGLSLVHQGRLVRGHAGRAGEIEHIKVRFEDFALPDKWKNVREFDELEPCSCNGTNCIARFATGKTIIDQLRDYDDSNLSYNQRGRRIEADAQRDVVKAVFARAGKLLGQALLGPVLAFDPQRIILSAFPNNAHLLQGLRMSLTDGTRVHLDPDDIGFASAKRERTAAGAGWLVVEQEVIPRVEQALATGTRALRRFELPYWLRSQVPAEEPVVSVFGPRYAGRIDPDLNSG